MNTLSRAVTARFFPHPDAYNALHKKWSVLINSDRRHELTAAHHFLYLALSGKDWRKTFTPPTNQRKLENGAFLGWAMFRALQTIKNRFKEPDLLAPFDGAITSQMLVELRDLLPTSNLYSFRPADFANGVFPFDAYEQENSAKATEQYKGISNA
jgi:hypothetical protein